MFFLKKLLSVFLVPTTAGLLLVAIGLVLLWLTSRDRAGKIFATVGLLLLVICSYGPVADAFVAPLEDQYHPLYPRERLDAAVRKAGGAPKWIVVLGGGHVSDPRVPANDQIGDSALARLVEAIRLHRELPGTKLLLSGGVGDKIKHADVLGAVASTLGIKPDEMVLDRTAWDTEQEAQNIGARLGKDRFVLVTSASHMPRAVALFKKQGLDPIPAPTYLWTLDEPGVSLSEVVPNPDALRHMDATAHEYFGLLWSKLRGRL